MALFTSTIFLYISISIRDGVIKLSIAVAALAGKVNSVSASPAESHAEQPTIYLIRYAGKTSDGSISTRYQPADCLLKLFTRESDYNIKHIMFQKPHSGQFAAVHLRRGMRSLLLRQVATGWLLSGAAEDRTDETTKTENRNATAGLGLAMESANATKRIGSPVTGTMSISDQPCWLTRARERQD